jgi:hypothetical protein
MARASDPGLVSVNEEMFTIEAVDLMPAYSPRIKLVVVHVVPFSVECSCGF